MNIKRIGLVLVSSISAVMAVGAHASTLESEKMLKAISKKASCDSNRQARNSDCEEADAIFEQIKDSKNVQIIYEMYLQQNVQMEMEFSGHGTGG